MLRPYYIHNFMLWLFYLSHDYYKPFLLATLVPSFSNMGFGFGFDFFNYRRGGGGVLVSRSKILK
jgi:hypothetical protein